MQVEKITFGGVEKKNHLPSIGKNITKNNEHVKKTKLLRHNSF